ncbi:MAG: hypothetical protein GPJ52_15315 [Candidatus Heimdallarchaeota archaeon]|nr:hypothetical protein [Candidatus Heimdallarchaeota archaeon]
MSRGGTNISQQVVLGTTVYDVMKNINLVGKDLLVEGGMKSPMILIGPTKFSGGK